MSCGKPGCGGGQIAVPAMQKAAMVELPKIADDQELYIEWVGQPSGTAGTLRVTGPATGHKYRFTISPRSKKLRPIVEGTPIGNQVAIEDARIFVGLIRHNQQQFTWHIKDLEEVEEETVEEDLSFDLSLYSVKQFAEAFKRNEFTVDRKALLEAEKAGKARKGILALLEEE